MLEMIKVRPLETCGRILETNMYAVKIVFELLAKLMFGKLDNIKVD